MSPTLNLLFQAENAVDVESSLLSELRREVEEPDETSKLGATHLLIDLQVQSPQVKQGNENPLG